MVKRLQMNRKSNLGVPLTIIYLALVALSLAIYALLNIYVTIPGQSLIMNLLSWTATLFATIALLYTFNSWREQKGSEILSDLCKEIYFDLNNLKSLTIEHTVIIIEAISLKRDTENYLLLRIEIQNIENNILNNIELILENIDSESFRILHSEFILQMNKYEDILFNLRDDLTISSETFQNFNTNKSKEIITQFNDFRKTFYLFHLASKKKLAKYIFHNN